MPFVTAIVTAVGSAVSAIGAAFTAINGFVAGLGAVGKGLLSLGFSVGLSAIQSALTKTPQQKPGSVTANLQIGGNIPRQVVFGKLGVKGQLVYAHTSGPAKSILRMVIVLSDGWCGALTRVRVNEVTKEPGLDLIAYAPVANEIQRWGVDGFNFGGAFGANEFSLQVQYYDGRPGQTANETLVSTSDGRLTMADRFAGMAYVIVTASQGQGNFDQIPDMTFEIEGYRCWDRRKDPAFGGTGTHDIANPASWEPSNNPAVQIENYLMGVRTEGQVFMGLAVPAHERMGALFAAAANICDEPVPLDAGGTEPRYRAAHLISAEDSDHRAALAPLLQAMAGYLVERSGLFGVIAGAAQLPAATITDADIIWGAGVTWSASKSRTERVNEVHGQYLFVHGGWQADSYPPIISAAGLAYDGERLAASLDLAAVQSVTQAQRIARARLRETRREATASLTVGFHLCWLDAGDWITWQSATFATTRTYRIASREIGADDTVTLSLQEVGNEIYSWSTADELPYEFPETPPGPGPLISTVQNFLVQADVVADRPVVRCTWSPILDTRIEAVIIEYRPVGTTNATRVRDDSPFDGLYVIDQPPTDVPFEFRATIVSNPPRLATWTSWVTIATIPRPGPGDGTVDVDKLAADARGQLNDIIADVLDVDFDQFTQDLRQGLDGRDLIDSRVTQGASNSRILDRIEQGADEQRAAARRQSIVEALIYDPVTGLPRVRADVTQLSEAFAAVDGRAAAAFVRSVEAETLASQTSARVDTIETAVTNAAGDAVAARNVALEARNEAADADGKATQALQVGATADGKAVAVQDEVLAARNGKANLAAEINDVRQVGVGNGAAIASLEIGAQARFGSRLADANIRFLSYADQSGATFSGIDIQTRQNSGTGWTDSGIRLFANNVSNFVEIGSRIGGVWRAAFSVNTSNGQMTLTGDVRIVGSLSINGGSVGRTEVGSRQITAPFFLTDGTDHVFSTAQPSARTVFDQSFSVAEATKAVIDYTVDAVYVSGPVLFTIEVRVNGTLILSHAVQDLASFRTVKIEADLNAGSNAFRVDFVNINVPAANNAMTVTNQRAVPLAVYR